MYLQVIEWTILLYGNSSFKFIYLTKYKLRIDLYKTV